MVFLCRLCAIYPLDDGLISVSYVYGRYQIIWSENEECDQNRTENSQTRAENIQKTSEKGAATSPHTTQYYHERHDRADSYVRQRQHQRYGPIPSVHPISVETAIGQSSRVLGVHAIRRHRAPTGKFTCAVCPAKTHGTPITLRSRHHSAQTVSKRQTQRLPLLPTSPAFHDHDRIGYPRDRRENPTKTSHTAQRRARSRPSPSGKRGLRPRQYHTQRCHQKYSHQVPVNATRCSGHVLETPKRAGLEE